MPRPYETSVTPLRLLVMRSRPTVRDVLRVLKKDGWVLVRTRGSHRQLRHPAKPGNVTVAGRLAYQPGPKTLRSILRQAGLEE
ncbi:MAG: type II toxin-antitoxin system HicA family toxin [Planctomycetota bacterium]